MVSMPHMGVFYHYILTHSCPKWKFNFLYDVYQKIVRFDETYIIWSIDNSHGI